MQGIHAVAAAHGDLGLWPTRPDYLDHELEHARLVVSEDGDGRISGFGAAIERSGATYLADLFVLPDRLGEGRGGAMMRELFPRPSPRFTFASSDPRTRPLYTRFGMRPFSRLLYLSADQASVRGLPDPGVELVEVAGSDVIDADRRASGRERPEDLLFLGTVGAFFVAGGAYGYLRIVGEEALLNPSGADEPDALARITVAMIRHAAGRASVIRVAAMESHPALAALLDAGFTVKDSDTYMSTAPELVEGTRYGPSPVIG